MHKPEIASQLRDAVNAAAIHEKKWSRIPLPASLQFAATNDHVAITIGKTGIIANMQEDGAALEGWALALMRWLGTGAVVIDVDETAADLGASLHFRRFAYRMERFSRLFPYRVRLEARLQSLMSPVEIPAGSGVLNVARAGRGYKGSPPPGTSEHAIEMQLCHGDLPRNRLMAHADLVRLCRQFPVGLFNQTVSRDDALRIFPGGKSAIDIVGVDQRGRLHVFELKNAKNRKVGAISELLFYTWVLDDARAGLFRFDDQHEVDSGAKVRPDDVLRAPAIIGHLLTAERHPLIDDAALRLLNEASADVGWALEYRSADWRQFGVDEGAPA